MKTNILITILGFFIACNASAEFKSPIRIETKIKGKADFADGPSKSKTQTRKIEVEITNPADQLVQGATMKWVVYGHKMKDHQLTAIKKGEKKVSVPANDSILVSSPEMTIKGNREYSVTSRSKKKGTKEQNHLQKGPCCW